MQITIESIRAAIIRQEGENDKVLNPGNLRGAPWLSRPHIDIANFWLPDSREEGIAGLDHLIALHRAQGNTLRDFIAGHPGIYSGFAPGSDGNKPDVYIANVMSWTGVPDADLPLWTWV